MKIEIWSDFVCPFCYLGKRRLEEALNTIPLYDVEITYRSFQLDPQATRHEEMNIHQLIAKKYGISEAQSKKSNDALVAQAAEVGLAYDFDQLKPNNTGVAHQIAKYAATVSLEAQLVERFLKGYFEEGVDIGNKEQLIDLAVEIGLDRDKVRAIIDGKTYEAAVKFDQGEAQRLGITGVPFFVINDKYGISGAQKPEYFVKILTSQEMK